MLGIGSGSFDPKTLVILESAFDEAWITLKTNGSANIRPDELARRMCQLAFTGPPHGAAQSLRAPPRRGRPFRPLSSVVRFLEIPQQPLDIFELELRAEVLAEAPAQFLENAPRALHIDLARHLDRSIVAVVAPA